MRLETKGWRNWTDYKSDQLFLRVTNHEMVDFLLPGVAEGTDQSGKEATTRPKVGVRISGLIGRAQPIALAEDEELGSEHILLIAIPRLSVTEQSVAAAKTAIGELTASTQNGSRYTSGVVGDTQGAQLSHPSDPQNPGVRGQMAGSRTTDPFNSGVDTLGPVSGAFRVKQEEGSGDRLELRDIPDGSENEDNRPQGTEYSLMGPSAWVRPTFRASFFDYPRTAKGVSPKQEAQDSNDPVKVETSDAA